VIICGVDGLYANSIIEIASLYANTLSIYACDKGIITEIIDYNGVSLKTVTLDKLSELKPDIALICANNKGEEIYDELKSLNIYGLKIYPIYDLQHAAWMDI
jgi:hypothetical protein